MFASKNKNFLIIFLFILSGIVIGGFLGEYISNFKSMDWLRYGQTVGFSRPLELNLSFMTLQFGITLKITIANIIGIALAIFAYKKLMK